ncbi:DUF202 domain-containing protein [Streptomyces alkaliphilus]|uniref:DUF202 domain-containing protein n=1 Tax=Streptomyces alkaliphilus TaxID=1472722 RepID=A0A7W3Y091_9ACTN|nr:DUF202 domain-containing protein [Streptomyces alkaliphilus]MBB0243163.1 DUF202 domain-containing protein [Streptomyces alkaliphilus]
MAARAWSTVLMYLSPRRLQREGTTPDYRFSLANERTFLAWVRTGLALLAGGIAVDQFLTDLTPGLRVTVAVTLLVTGALCALHAVRHWVRCELAMRRDRDLPVSRVPLLLGLIAGTLGAAVAVAFVVGGVR